MHAATHRLTRDFAAGLKPPFVRAAWPWVQVAAGLLLAASGAASLAAGHCKAPETTYFSCRIKDSPHTASLCGSASQGGSGAAAVGGAAAADAGWLQYRYGPAERIEFSYPAERQDSLAQFEGERQLRPRSSAAAVIFRDKGVTFTLVSNTGELAFTGLWLTLEKVRAPDLQCDGVPEVDRLRDAIKLLTP